MMKVLSIIILKPRSSTIKANVILVGFFFPTAIPINTIHRKGSRRIKMYTVESI